MFLTLDKDIPAASLGGLKGCETSRLSHFVENRLTDDCEVVSLERKKVAASV
jgi:hypothetical protein